MSLAAKITAGTAVLAVAGLVALAAATALAPADAAPPASAKPPAVEETFTATDNEAAAAGAPLTELPQWALQSAPWLIYPEGFKCAGTEGCPNDYRAIFGEPGDVLPEHVEYYDPAVHDWVFPANQ